ncbi:hypothetical protein PVAG01_00656 [Phlyctema vagabunda]|uniref:CBS domain-containing protein n=1 Tax=Phlyctema vagabunda TaxID=108571 RepID=A0ABR4PVG4_9HELO
MLSELKASLFAVKRVAVNASKTPVHLVVPNDDEVVGAVNLKDIIVYGTSSEREEPARIIDFDRIVPRPGPARSAARHRSESFCLFFNGVKDHRLRLLEQLRGTGGIYQVEGHAPHPFGPVARLHSVILGPEAPDVQTEKVTLEEMDRRVRF